MGWLRSSRLHSPKCRPPKFRSSNTRSLKCRSPKLHSPKFRSPKFRSPKFRSPKLGSPKLGSSQIRSPKCRSSSFPPIVIVLSSIGRGRGLVSGKSGKHWGGKHGGAVTRGVCTHTHTGRERRAGARGERVGGVAAERESSGRWWGWLHTQTNHKMATWTHDFGVCERACIQNPSFKIPSPRAHFQTSEIPSTWNRRRPF